MIVAVLILMSVIMVLVLIGCFNVVRDYKESTEVLQNALNESRETCADKEAIIVSLRSVANQSIENMKNTSQHCKNCKCKDAPIDDEYTGDDIAEEDTDEENSNV